MFLEGGLPAPLDENSQNELLGIGMNVTRIPEENRRTIIERNLRLVTHISKKFQNTRVDSDDLFQIGAIGLIKAASGYNPTKKVKFATYASKCISYEILMYLRCSKKHKHIAYLQDAVINSNGDTYILEDTLEDGNQDFEDALIYKLMLPDLYDKVDSLGEKSKFIVFRRIIPLEGEKSKQVEVSQALKLSQSRVSILEKESKENLRKLLKDYL